MVMSDADVAVVVGRSVEDVVDIVLVNEGVVDIAGALTQ